jgi:hypothetical protein
MAPDRALAFLAILARDSQYKARGSARFNVQPLILRSWREMILKAR